VGVFLDLGLLARHLRLVHFPLRLRRQVRARAHRQRARQRPGESGGEHHFAAARIAGHAGDDAEDRAEAVVDAVDRVADPAGAADVPALAAQNRLERRARRRDGATGERPQDDRVIPLLDHRLFRDLAIGGIGEAGHQLLVFLFGFVLLLLEAMEHDVGIGNALETMTGRARPPCGRDASCRGSDALGPSRRVLFLLLGKAHEDVPCAGDLVRGWRDDGRSRPLLPRDATSAGRWRDATCRAASAPVLIGLHVSGMSKAHRK
jgi:hypothetical protein